MLVIENCKSKSAKILYTSIKSYQAVFLNLTSLKSLGKYYERDRNPRIRTVMAIFGIFELLTYFSVMLWEQVGSGAK